MAIIASAGLVEEWYTPVDERGEEVATRFKLKALNQLDLLEVFSEGQSLADGSFLPNHRGRMILLRKGLKDWENLNTVDGQVVGFSITNLDRVPAQVLAELANEILTRSALTDEEKKT